MRLDRPCSLSPPQRWLRTSALALFLAAASISTAHAEAESAWGLSGFGTVGLTSQSGGSGWGFMRNGNQPGATSSTSFTSDSRAGVQVNWSSGAQWEAAVQAVGFQRPPGTPLSESIEWAYAAYRLGPNTRIRVGRTSPDIFLFADSRNVGYALPWARPPVDFYGFSPVSSLDGIDLEHRWTSGDANWRGRVATGSFDSSSSSSTGERYPLHGRDVWALSLAREQGGLLLKASYLRTRLKADLGPDIQQLRAGLDQLPDIPVPGLADAIDPLRQNLWAGGPGSYLALAAQYDTGPWTIITEGSNLRVPNSPLDARRGYASVSYRLGEVSYYGLVSRVAPRRAAASTPDLVTPLTPVIGPQGAQQAQVLAGYAAAAGALSRYDQSTVGIGMRWDMSPTTALKIQADRFKVHPAGGAGWRNSSAQPTQGTLLTVLVDFVWGQ